MVLKACGLYETPPLFHWRKRKLGFCAEDDLSCVLHYLTLDLLALDIASQWAS